MSSRFKALSLLETDFKPSRDLFSDEVSARQDISEEPDIAVRYNDDVGLRSADIEDSDRVVLFFRVVEFENVCKSCSIDLDRHRFYTGIAYDLDKVADKILSCRNENDSVAPVLDDIGLDAVKVDLFDVMRDMSFSLDSQRIVELLLRNLRNVDDSVDDSVSRNCDRAELVSESLLCEKRFYSIVHFIRVHDAAVDHRVYRNRDKPEFFKLIFPLPLLLELGSFDQIRPEVKSHQLLVIKHRRLLWLFFIIRKNFMFFIKRKSQSKKNLSLRFHAALSVLFYPVDSKN